MWNSPGLAALVGLLTAVLGGGGVGAALFVLEGGKVEQSAGGEPTESGTDEPDAAKQKLLATGACTQVSESSTLLEVAEDCAAELEQMREDLDSFKQRNADAQRALEVIHGQ